MNELVTIRPEYLTLSGPQFQALLPFTLVFLGTVLAIFGSVLRSVPPKWPVFVITMVTLIVGTHFSLESISGAEGYRPELFGGMMTADGFSGFFNIVFLLSALFTALASFRYLDHEKLQHPEYYVLLLFSALGMMLMVSALDLIVMFIALELMSLSVYALVGFRRADRRSNEAAMKYFILGSAASAVLLYGAAILYGTTGTLNIKGILSFAQAHPQNLPVTFMLGAWLVVAGFLFKVASVPFHMWMPDVYEGAPTPITGFMTTGLKAAAFAAFVRILSSTGYGRGLAEIAQDNLRHLLWASAVLTMVVGNVVALTQTNLKRMLAYSSIAHTGYLLIGLLVGARTDQSYAPVVLYLVAYAAMNLGAFVILTVLAQRDDSGLNLHDLSGLSSRHPWLAFAMAVFLLSMAGIPPTAGFAAKYLLFYSAVQAGEIPLVIIAVLCSAVSVYYYLRVLVYMYMRDAVGSPAATRVSIWSAAAVTVMVALTIQMGVLPARIVAAAKKAVISLS